MVVSGVGFLMVNGSLVGLFYDNTTLAHQMPQASAVHHITVTPQSIFHDGEKSRCCLHTLNIAFLEQCSSHTDPLGITRDQKFN
jgi:hypothetical protein